MASFESLGTTSGLVQRHSSFQRVPFGLERKEVQPWQSHEIETCSPKKAKIEAYARKSHCQPPLDCDKVVRVLLAVVHRSDHGIIGYAIACTEPPRT
jgi:hypothetical protein